MTVSLIVAMSQNRVIGHRGDLPWRIIADLQRFKRLTMGHHLIMGRKTLESIGRLLPGRTTIVLTQDPGYRFPGATVAHDWPQAVEIASGDDEIFVCGGAQIYQLALPCVDRIYLTLVAARVQGDAFFPEWDLAAWEITEDTPFPADAKNEYPHHFQILKRVGQQSSRSRDS